jgi:hypothetical protein
MNKRLPGQLYQQLRAVPLLRLDLKHASELSDALLYADQPQPAARLIFHAYAVILDAETEQMIFSGELD